MKDTLQDKHVWVWTSDGRPVFGRKLVPYAHHGRNSNILVDKACSCGLVSTFACHTYTHDGELNKDYSTSEEVCPRATT